MAKKNAPEVKEEQKIQTKYDRKMAERKAQEKKDKRDEKIFKIVSSVIGIVLVLAIVIGIGSTIVKKQVAVNGTYIQVGDRDVSRLEYDFTIMFVWAIICQHTVLWFPTWVLIQPGILTSSLMMRT